MLALNFSLPFQYVSEYIGSHTTYREVSQQNDIEFLPPLIVVIYIFISQSEYNSKHTRTTERNGRSREINEKQNGNISIVECQIPIHRN